MNRFCRASSSTSHIRRLTCQVTLAQRHLHASPLPGNDQDVIQQRRTRRREEGRGKTYRGLQAGAKSRFAQDLAEIAVGKANNRRPSAVTYTALLKQALHYTERYNDLTDTGSTMMPSNTDLAKQIALAVVRDAAAAGVELGPNALEILLKISRYHPDLLHPLIVASSHYDEPPLEFYIALCSTSKMSPGQHIFVISEMIKRNRSLPSEVLGEAVELCSIWSSPRLASQLAEFIKNQASPSPKTLADVGADILSACAENNYIEGLESAWDHLSRSKSFTPDEGTLMRVLDVAARHARPDFAANVFATLSLISVDVRVEHIVPLLEAYVNAGRMTEAIRVICSIPEVLDPSLDSVVGFTCRLKTSELIDQTFYTMEDMHKAGDNLSLLALNSLVQAAIRLGDLQRARAIQSAMKDLDVRPDIHTYNLILQGCVAAEHRALGDAVLSEIQQQELSPNAETYQIMIDLCLLPNEYEDAFFYLEKMKAEGMKPTAHTYRNLLQKCVRSKDARWKFVLEEMETLGYASDAATRRIVNSNS